MEADRQRAVVEQRVVERAEVEPRPESLLLVGPELQQQDLAEQVGELVGRRVRVAIDLRPGVRPLEARLVDEEVRRLLDADLAAVHPHVEDDPAGPPDRVRVQREAEVRGVVEALLAHHLLGVHAPALDELRRVGEEPGQARVAVGDRELEMMARVGLVDARVADRAVVVLAHRVRVVADRRRDDVDALRVRVELRRREVRRERDDVAEVLGGRDHVDPLVVRDRDDLPFDEVVATPDHHVAVGVEGLVERRRMVALDAVDDRRLVDARVDLARRSDSRRLVRRELLLADREDRVGVEPVERPERTSSS